ncbi:MAG: ATP synthase F0 subunit B [Candidatus Eremiobacteraeota bacterium]|nr:ATP synthase F0 subunit B [Candidatus Eremiobacteraeota bacterium]MCW5868484.1 ATP synthase F0 subunit B [Candidatus Eremiobacteraeota bacterium]
MEAIVNFLESLHFSPYVFGIQIFLFLGFHMTMKTLIYDPIGRARNEREGRIDGHLARAEAAAANAKGMKLKYDEEIKAQRAVLAQELKEATDKAEKAAAERMQLARDEAGKLTDDANARLNDEENQLKASMDQEAGKLALAVASQVVRNSLSEDAQGRVLAQLKG